jgi:hypothetical protein
MRILRSKRRLVADQPTKVPAWLAALIAALTIATVAVVGLHPGKPTTPPVVTTATTATTAPPATVTEPPATATEPPPVTETQPPVPAPTAEEAAAIAEAKRRASHPPATNGCTTAEEIDTANHYASFAGYEALAGKCDWLRGYRAAAASPNPPADLVVYLCDNGYDSPAAEREVQREIIFDAMWDQEVCVQLIGYGDPICQDVKFTDTERVVGLRESLADPTAKIVKTLRFWEPCTAKFLSDAIVVSHSVIATRTHTITVADVIPPPYHQYLFRPPMIDYPNFPVAYKWAAGDRVWHILTSGVSDRSPYGFILEFWLVQPGAEGNHYPADFGNDHATVVFIIGQGPVQ